MFVAEMGERTGGEGRGYDTRKAGGKNGRDTTVVLSKSGKTGEGGKGRRKKEARGGGGGGC